MTAVLDFLKSVDVEQLSAAEAQEYLRVLGSWQQKIAGAVPSMPTAPAPAPVFRKVESPRLSAKTTDKPQPLPSVTELAQRALPHGPGNFSLIAARFRRAFGLTLSHGKLAKQSYAQNCQAFGEEFVLQEFEQWQKSNQWMRDKGYTNLYQFYESLASASEAAKLIQADAEQVTQKKEQVEAAKTDAIEAGRAETLKKAIQRQQQKRAEEAAVKFAEENPEQLFS